MVICRVCKVELDTTNQHESAKWKGDHICKYCRRIRDKLQNDNKPDVILKRELIKKQLEERDKFGMDVNPTQRWARANRISSLDKDGNPIRIRCKKRYYPVNHDCEICSRVVKRLVYHHWDDEHPYKGLWVCMRCHMMAECADDGIYSIKYLELKELIDDENCKISRII